MLESLLRRDATTPKRQYSMLKFIDIIIPSEAKQLRLAKEMGIYIYGDVIEKFLIFNDVPLDHRERRHL